VELCRVLLGVRKSRMLIGCPLQACYIYGRWWEASLANWLLDWSAHKQNQNIVSRTLGDRENQLSTRKLQSIQSLWSHWTDKFEETNLNRQIWWSESEGKRLKDDWTNKSDGANLMERMWTDKPWAARGALAVHAAQRGALAALHQVGAAQRWRIAKLTCEASGGHSEPSRMSNI
jgi:hypothetical protein